MKYLLILLFCTALLGCAKGPAQVRVQNLTGHEMREVTVEETAFGGVPAVSYSTVKAVALLYANPTVLTTDDKGDIRNRRVFQHPKGPLGTGKFVVALTLDQQGQLQVLVSKDQ